MALNLNYAGGLNAPVCQRLENTSTTRIGDAAVNDTLTLSGFSIANDAAAAKMVSLWWFDGTNEKLIWKKSIAQDDTAVVADVAIRLRKGNEIRVKGDVNVHVTLIHSFNVPYSRAQAQGLQ
jgi:hypothetical protein